MRIGILTLSASDNCGSLLQAYALKKILEKYGETEIINFSSNASHAMYDVYPKHENIISKIKYAKKRKSIQIGKNGYNEFREMHLGIRGKEFFARDLYVLDDKYDIVVVGSDQVWNVQMGDFDEAFFLGWSHSKKVAYAPSLGGRHLSLSPDYDLIKEWLKGFSYISVREEIGKKCLEEVTGRKVPKVLDPTLVIDKEYWDDLAGDEPLVKEDYIFYYSWAYCDESTSLIVSDESKRLQMPVYVIDPRKWLNKSPDTYGFILFEQSGPQVFINLMKFAKKCYVESFHGMVFAYLFNKNFWLLDTHESKDELDSRLMEFVLLLGAEERILTRYNVNSTNLDSEFRYCDNRVLSNMKYLSKQFMNEAFGEDVSCDLPI